MLSLMSILFLTIGLWIVGTGNVLQEFGRIPAWAIIGILFAFGLNLQIVSFRLWRLFSHFGVRLPFGVVYKANLQGQFASLFLVSLIGQVAGRHWTFQHHGIPSVAVAALTIIERTVMLLVGGGLCLFGMAWLFDDNRISSFFGKTPFIPLFATAFLGALVSLWAGRSRFEKRLIAQTISKKIIGGFLEIGVITFLAYGLMLGAFILAGKALAPGAGFWDLLAAAAITSFAASMPISVGGWGVRELTAVFAFGQIGVPGSSAMAVSILIGLCSTAVILAFYPFIFSQKKQNMKDMENSRKNEARKESYPTDTRNHIPVEKTSAWILSIAVASLIFFQFHVSLFDGTLNLNLADPFALLALAATVSHCISARTLPVWRWREFNRMLLAISVLLFFAFVYGLQTIGVTSWALGGRLGGWLVLLGYLCIGPLTVSYLGMRGMWRFFETLVVMAGIIVLSCVFVRWMALAGWIGIPLPGNFEGYAGNRNAFAFQMLACSVLLVAFSQYQVKWAQRLPGALGKNRLLVFFHGLILAGLAFSASRAGIGAAVILFVFVWIAKLVDRRMLLFSLIWAALIYAVTVLVSRGFVSGFSTSEISSGFSQGSSDLEHWATIQRGMEMWLNSPFLGAGLGVFIEKSILWFNQPVVIHSTPVWILAEFGLLGALILFTAFYRLCLFACRQILVIHYAYRGIFMLLGIFAIFGIVHEIFYQRIFWLILGACLALPFRSTPSPRAENLTQCSNGQASKLCCGKPRSLPWPAMSGRPWERAQGKTSAFMPSLRIKAKSGTPDIPA
jgi:uncharacterized membrane protein YbhN (UPF0104 family)